VEKTWNKITKWHAKETLGPDTQTLDFLSETRPYNSDCNVRSKADK